MDCYEHVQCCEEKEDARSEASKQSLLEVIEVDPVLTHDDPARFAIMS